MKKKTIIALFALILMSLSAAAQTISPKAIYVDSLGVTNEVTSIDNGQAPLEVSFKANPSGLGSNTASYEWHFRRDTGNNKFEEMFVRYEEDTQYTFNESGTYSILLKAKIDQDGSDIDPDSIKIVIADSWLDFPNAFTPNGDGLNDVYRAKSGYRSIVQFRATIINRWARHHDRQPLRERLRQLNPMSSTDQGDLSMGFVPKTVLNDQSLSRHVHQPE